MRLKLWLIASTVLATVAIVSGVTLATFRAQTTPADTTFTSGQVCLQSYRDNGQSVPGPMFYVTSDQGRTTDSRHLPPTPGSVTGVWAPGDHHNRQLNVYNPMGCLDAWMDTVQASLQTGSDGSVTLPGGRVIYFPDELWVKIYTPSDSGVSDVLVAEGYLSQFLAGPVNVRYQTAPGVYPAAPNIPIFEGGTRDVHFDVTFDLDADDYYQNKTVVVDFTVNTVQMIHNP